jgi:hypothetical protein
MLWLGVFAISVVMSIIVLVVVFSAFPQLFTSFSCPDPAEYVNDAGAEAWATSCANLKTQTTFVPMIITLGVVVLAVLICARIFGV